MNNPPCTVSNPPCTVSSGDFFTQKLVVGLVPEHSWLYCKQLSEGKRVLHVGCSDFPIFSKEGNMHIFLSKIASELAGCDINGIDELKGACPGKYYESIDLAVWAGREWDVVLVPNIIEHLPNPGLMVAALFKLNFNKMFVLVPNYTISEQATYADGVWTERIHPDHFAWYSPYTLWKLFSEGIKAGGYECEMNFFDQKNMISILISKK